GLAGGIRAPRSKGVRLLRLALQYLAVYLIRTDLAEQLNLSRPRRFEQHIGAPHVGVDEASGIQNRPVDLRLRREMHEDSHPSHQLSYEQRVGDIARHKLVAWIVVDWRQVLQVASVRQLVEDDYHVLRIVAEVLPYEGAPNEARSARHQ